MIYIACSSGLHRLIAKEIKKEFSEISYIVNFDKKFTLIEKISTSLKAIKFIFICLFDKKSHAVIPHPFNPWFALLAFAARKHSIMDDGIAFYYPAPIPDKLVCQIYMILASRMRSASTNTNTNTNTNNLSYSEYLSQCKTERYFCFFPSETLYQHPKTVLLKPKPFQKISTKTHITVFLDTAPNIFKLLDQKKVIKYLEIKSQETHIMVKGHPRHTSIIANALKDKPWATIIDDDYEEILGKYPVSNLYTVYSSATLTNFFLQPETKLHCFTSQLLSEKLAPIHTIFEKMHVEFIDCEPQPQ